jgi:cysteinyl-tRNA synthetase
LNELNHLPEEKAFFKERIDQARTEFLAGCADDLNTSRALGAVFELIRDLNPHIESQGLSREDVLNVMSFMKEFNSIADILKTEDELLPEEIERLIEDRQQARRDRNFARSDEIRDQLKSKGIILEDTREGVRWKKL